jgi:hypothetical protein
MRRTQSSRDSPLHSHVPGVHPEAHHVLRYKYNLGPWTAVEIVPGYDVLRTVYFRFVQLQSGLFVIFG